MASGLDKQFARIEDKLKGAVEEIALEVIGYANWQIHKPITEEGAMSSIGSPVDTGDYIGSHSVSVGSATGGAIALDDMDAVTGQLRGQGFTLGKSAVLFNPLSYARDLENKPSPLRKTSGEIYENAALNAVQNVKEQGQTLINRYVQKYNIATPEKIEAKI